MKTRQTKASNAARLSALLTIPTLLTSFYAPKSLALSAEEASQAGHVLISQADDVSQRERAAYDNSGYTFADASALVVFWGGGDTTEEAKAYIGRQILLGGESIAALDSVLVEAREQAADLEEAQASTNRNVFYNSDYTYDDAVELADFWGIDISDTKARIGSKIISGGSAIAILEEDLAQARSQQPDQLPESDPATAGEDIADNSEESIAKRNAFYDSDYTYEDASALADYWGVSVSESKTRMGGKILAGEGGIIDLQNVLEDAQEDALNQATSGETGEYAEDSNSAANAGEQNRGPIRSAMSAIGKFFGSLFG
jgi:hypothetical protein